MAANDRKRKSLSAANDPKGKSSTEAATAAAASSSASCRCREKYKTIPPFFSQAAASESPSCHCRSRPRTGGNSRISVPFIPGVKYNKKVFAKYRRQVNESDGFDIKDFPIGCPMASVIPWTAYLERPEHAATIKKLSTKAIRKFNSEHEEKYKFVKVNTVNAQVVSGYVFYITFQARKVGADPNDPLITFQAQVWERIRPEKPIVRLCRIKRSP